MDFDKWNDESMWIVYSEVSQWFILNSQYLSYLILWTEGPTKRGQMERLLQQGSMG